MNLLKVSVNEVMIDYLNAPLSKDSTNKTIKIKNTIFAIPAAAPAIPPKPKTAAMIAIIINVIVQRNIKNGF
jgi:hypothetical protein